MVQFAKLRLVGFKSFVDPTEIAIEPGMTGIVGPNGCGKSNLLEALRWCMGEASAKRLRGGGMDDVIFNGTSARPQRNLAEVAIFLDNRDRKAPAAFNEFDELEIVRRIEREKGSDYSVNGRDVRARDVQLLFADLSSGAKSTSIVGQGRVGAIVNAKPPERRAILEEAAGITGLHSRRHEAELRLRAAEQNLARLNDVVTALAGQLQGLKRQARQASRYRNLSDHIRKQEAIVLHLRWTAASQALAEARARLGEIEAEVNAATAEAAAASTALAEAGAAIPGLRQEEAAAAAERQRALVEAQALEAEAQRIARERREAGQRLEQIAADRAREEALLADAIAASERLAEEAARLEALEAEDAQARRLANERVAAADAAVRAGDQEATALAQKIAADEARRIALSRRLQEIEARLAVLQRQIAANAGEREKLEAQNCQLPLDLEEKALAEAEAADRAAEIEFDSAEQARLAAEPDERATRLAAERAGETVARLSAEEKGLEALIAAPAESRERVLDRVRARPGYEAALGAALGDDLEASLDPSAPLHWQRPAEAAPPDLPAGVQPLADFVEAPPELARRLAQIGVAEDEAAAAPAIAGLAQGQRLVTKNGALWRWDGYVRAASAPTAAAARLRHKNRLADVARERREAEIRATEAREAQDVAAAAAAAATERARAARERARTTRETLNRARDAAAKAARAAAERRARFVALAEAAERLAADAREAEAAAAEARAELAGLPDPGIDRAELDRLRGELQTRRQHLAERQQIANRLAAEAETRGRRLAAIADEARSWSARRGNGERQIAALDERRAATQVEIDALAARPAEIERRRHLLLDAAEAAETRRRGGAERLAAAEARQAELDRALKAIERRMADAREARGRSEGALAQGEANLAQVTARIAERLECAPEAALAVSEWDAEEPLPAPEEAEKRLDRLVRERETMGPVNLRADEEATELETQIASYESERGDLTGAIERFRRAIGELNREGRDRLKASFEAVNGHFETLFTRLFGGGHAHLELIEAEDPLEGGLEIMASPPGKKLQSLSLLSGGEQALTALALLFAVFLTNPAPICILDEVDAPLDDANVDRFCTLVQDIAKDTATRFLVVTHHRMTMARMHRLYGVTMMERGVSKLVSVDLEEAEKIRDAA